MAKDMANNIVKEASEKAYEQGIEKGKKENLVQTAKRFLEKGIPIEVISECINLPVEEIRELRIN